MKIAFTFNLKQNDSEEQAEFDSPETIKYITENLKKAGHLVEHVELSRPLTEVINHLLSLNPDLIFNTAEGSKGRLREAFWPSVFENLNIPFTGADAYSLALTLDKNLTKKIVADYGVQTPKSKFIVSPDQDLSELKFPIIIKPNFEGSSKGISQKSIVESEQALKTRIKELLSIYPEGLLIEEFIHGADLTVPFLEHLGENSVLPAITYLIDPKITQKRTYNIYDYELKNYYYDYVDVKIFEAEKKIIEKINQMAKQIIRAVGCRDLGRMDMRMDNSGQIYFIEINCLPSLEKGAGIFIAAENKGLDASQTLEAVIQSAKKRYQIK